MMHEHKWKKISNLPILNNYSECECGKMRHDKDGEIFDKVKSTNKRFVVNK